MNTDTIALLIAGSFGLIVGGTIAFLCAGVFAERAKRSVERRAWREATRFYAVKNMEGGMQ